MLPDSLVEKATTKYNNMVLQKIWNQTDPKDTKILALTTKLEVLESAFNASATGPKGPAPKKANGSWEPEYWLITNVGPSVEKDGKTLCWCPHHKDPQTLAVPHASDIHSNPIQFQ